MAAMEIKVDTKSTEKELNEMLKDGKAVEEKVEKSLDYDSLTENEKDAIREFNSKLDLFNQNDVLQYGVNAQKKISDFSDTILEQVRTKDLREAGDLLAQLVSQIRSYDSQIKYSSGGIFKIFNSVKRQIKEISAKYNKVEKNVDIIEESLEKNKVELLRDITTFDTMYEKNLEYFKELSLYIIAGEKKLEEVRETLLPELRRNANTTMDHMDAQKVNDLENQINRFEKKLYDLKTTRIISLQLAPQIRLLQNSNAELVEKIQSSITNTIPLWKNQMVLALGIARTQGALEDQKAVSNLTNEMLKKNSETLKQGSIEIAKESERSIVDIETIKKTNRDLIDTLDNVLKIHEEGRIKRLEAESELHKVEDELKNKMLELNVNKEDVK